MPKIIGFGLFLLSTIIYSQTITVIDSSYTNSFERPILLYSGNIIQIDADSIYLVNKPRLTLYEDIRSQLMSMDIDCETSIDLYRKSLEQNRIITDKLIDNSFLTNRLSKNLLVETKQLLSENEKTIIESLAQLKKAKQNLSEVQNELLNIDQNTFFDNLLYALAGIGVGILVGVSLN